MTVIATPALSRGKQSSNWIATPPSGGLAMTAKGGALTVFGIQVVLVGVLVAILVETLARGVA
jgi:hypothetical protein